MRKLCNTELGNGKYKGIWTSYSLTINGKEYKTVYGIKSINPVEVLVEVINTEIFLIKVNE